jgi:hypothetical protein
VLCLGVLFYDLQFIFEVEPLHMSAFVLLWKSKSGILREYSVPKRCVNLVYSVQNSHQDLDPCVSLVVYHKSVR